MTANSAPSFPQIARRDISTLQVNLGYQCTQACRHCHVEAGPHRTEMMDQDTINLIVPVMQARGIQKLDLTGGAPELHPHFKQLVAAAVAAGLQVSDRCNLTILLEPGQAGLASFLAQHRVEVIASLPCYSADNVDQQRGLGSYEKSILGLQLLNQVGYGQAGSNLHLNLVYNPLGPSLPPNQQRLQADYQQELFGRYGIVFNKLFTVTNMPVHRFRDALLKQGRLDEYLQLLRNNFAPDNLEQLMCRQMINVGWQGQLYDCDFNQQLDFQIHKDKGLHLSDLLHYELVNHPIQVAEHCFGCTAGQGSSCGGALSVVAA